MIAEGPQFGDLGMEVAAVGRRRDEAPSSPATAAAHTLGRDREAVGIQHKPVVAKAGTVVHRHVVGRESRGDHHRIAQVAVSVVAGDQVDDIASLEQRNRYALGRGVVRILGYTCGADLFRGHHDRGGQVREGDFQGAAGVCRQVLVDLEGVGGRQRDGGRGYGAVYRVGLRRGDRRYKLQVDQVAFPVVHEHPLREAYEVVADVALEGGIKRRDEGDLHAEIG